MPARNRDSVDTSTRRHVDTIASGRSTRCSRAVCHVSCYRARGAAFRWMTRPPSVHINPPCEHPPFAMSGCFAKSGRCPASGTIIGTLAARPMVARSMIVVVPSVDLRPARYAAKNAERGSCPRTVDERDTGCLRRWNLLRIWLVGRQTQYMSTGAAQHGARPISSSNVPRTPCQ